MPKGDIPGTADRRDAEDAKGGIGRMVSDVRRSLIYRAGEDGNMFLGASRGKVTIAVDPNRITQSANSSVRGSSFRE